MKRFDIMFGVRDPQEAGEGRKCVRLFGEMVVELEENQEELGKLQTWASSYRRPSVVLVCFPRPSGEQRKYACF